MPGRLLVYTVYRYLRSLLLHHEVPCALDYWHPQGGTIGAENPPPLILYTIGALKRPLPEL